MTGPDRVSFSVSPVKHDNQYAIGFDRMRFPLLVCGVVAGLWLAFALVVVPPIIESAYRGESLPVLNGMIQGQHVNPITYYLQKWNRITVSVLVSWVGLWLLAMLMSSAGFFRRFVGEATPGTLGAIRAWT